jgi:[glutamine synthetase] adenylyltransferase / [glutamine synthetase]-adenylyl-L-tyrosine phosphorylase
MADSDFAYPALKLPPPINREAGRIALERWREAADETGDPALAVRAAELIDDAAACRLLHFVFGNSPYLSAIAVREPAFTADLVRHGPDQARASVLAATEDATRKALAGANPARELRIAKRRLALAAAVADITETWSLAAVTGALSQFAEAALECAASYMLLETARRGAFSLPHPGDPQRDSGLIVLAMGKLGACELNYSSDIDLIVFYDVDRVATDDPDRLQYQFVRLTQGLVRLMDERTADGYVFRTDLRLRPDPSATPAAVSVLAAETYYETLGQNWERAAMIKARPVAGDRQAAQDFLGALRPFVWRKNLDFAAIQDIHSIKRQINAHRGGGRIAVGGHNIKLGRGGIREIEFYAQTQQLIWGGRVPELRAIGTVDALRRLARHGIIEGEAAGTLIEAYGFLRRVEHRLQMINDEQTHTLPRNPEDLRALANFLGYPETEAFERDLLAHLRAVEGLYARLFEDSPALSVEGSIGGNLVFTGAEADPETLDTLKGLGFSNPKTVDGVVRGWHHGRYTAMRSTRARELLTELMPVLLKALADTPDPDASLLTFDRFLSGLPAGVQLFSMFHSKPQLLGLVAEIMGGAPRLANHLSRNPLVLEGVLMADLFAPPPPAEDLAADLDATLAQARDLQDALDLVRRWANDRKFQVGIQTLRGLLEAPQAGMALSNIAEVALRALYPRVEREFAVSHGRVPGCEMAILALGKLGGREVTATSDLDLIFVYTTPQEGAQSDGPRPLVTSQYFARLSQRFINAVTAPTAEGILYEVDMRLRPSGKAGPIAVSFESFQRYQHDAAWTWERMALTRARPVCGPEHLTRDLKAVIRDVLTQRRDDGQLVRDVADMRALMDAEHHTDSLWDVKYLRGGLVDIEFIAQYKQLLHAHDHPEILSTATAEALAACRDAGLIDRGVAGDLLDALLLWQTVQSRLRLTLTKPVVALGGEDAPEALRRAVKGIDGLDFHPLVARMEAIAARTFALFQTQIEREAEALRSP